MGDPLLFLLEEVERYGVGVVRLQQLLLLPFQALDLPSLQSLLDSQALLPTVDLLPHQPRPAYITGEPAFLFLFLAHHVVPPRPAALRLELVPAMAWRWASLQARQRQPWFE